MPINEVPLLKMSLYIPGITNMIKIILESKTLLLKKGQPVNFTYLVNCHKNKKIWSTSTNLDRLTVWSNASRCSMRNTLNMEDFFGTRGRPSPIFTSLWWARQSTEKRIPSSNLVSTHTLKSKPNWKEWGKVKKIKTPNHGNQCGKIVYCCGLSYRMEPKHLFFVPFLILVKQQ